MKLNPPSKLTLKTGKEMIPFWNSQKKSGSTYHHVYAFFQVQFYASDNVTASWNELHMT